MNLTYETEVIYQGQEYFAEVNIDITNVVVVPPDHSTWDSDYDYYGTKELSFDVEAVHLYDEDGVVVQVILDKAEIEGFNLDYDKIEAWCWEVLEEMKGNREDYDMDYD